MIRSDCVLFISGNVLDLVLEMYQEHEVRFDTIVDCFRSGKESEWSKSGFVLRDEGEERERNRERKRRGERNRERERGREG